MDFFPVVGLVVILTTQLFISGINAFKILLMFLYFGYALFKLTKLKKILVPSQAIGLALSVFYLYFILDQSHYTKLIFNNLLIFSSGLYFLSSILTFRNTSKKAHKEVSEVNLIAFIGALILGLSDSYFMTNVGIGIICVNQIAELAIYTKILRDDQRDIKGRLVELESRFERTVEFEAKKRTSVMTEKIEHIREKSQKDPMTKALNRHGITSEINDLIRDPGVKMFSIALFDIDHFKGINDTKGHIVGDECLKFLSYTFMINNRKTDVLGRYGGDEFILIMPHINAPAALEICERMREMIQAKSVPKFTISMGVSTFPYDGKSFTSLLEVADKGLYIAKENGRNRVGYDGNVFIKS